MPKYTCLFKRCEKKARIVGRFFTGTDNPAPLTYCPEHRKYGEELIDRFLLEIYRHRFGIILNRIRHDICMDGKFHFCEDCDKRLMEFMKDSAEELQELEEKDKH